MGTLNVKTFAAGRLTQAAAERGYLPLLMKTVANNIDEESLDDVRNLTEPHQGFSILRILREPLKAGDGTVPL